MKRIDNKLIFKVLILLTTSIFIGTLVGCGSSSKMPFNGEITFHDITITIPEKFIRDSTQSNDDLWLFEHGFYSEMIILSRKDAVGDTTSTLNEYLLYMKEEKCDSELTLFLQNEAVHTTYTKDGQFCQEMLWEHNDSYYAIALRGGTEEEFQSLLDTVALFKHD